MTPSLLIVTENSKIIINAIRPGQGLVFKVCVSRTRLNNTEQNKEIVPMLLILIGILAMGNPTHA